MNKHWKFWLNIEFGLLSPLPRIFVYWIVRKFPVFSPGSQPLQRLDLYQGWSQMSHQINSFNNLVCTQNYDFYKNLYFWLLYVPVFQLGPRFYLISVFWNYQDFFTYNFYFVLQHDGVRDLEKRVADVSKELQEIQRCPISRPKQTDELDTL